MKKSIVTLAMLLLVSALMHAQYIQADFEPDGIGADWAWTVGENGDNPPVEFVGNPDASGNNTSATVAQFTARQSGQAWALCFTDDIPDFEFDATNTTISIQVYKPVVSPIALKFEGTSAPLEIQVPNTLTNQWETVTFDFSGATGITYSRLIIIPDFEVRPEDRVIYFDNIQLPESNVDPIPEPENPAPTPGYAQEDVISLYSNAYSDVPVDTWSADWDDADVSDVQIQGNDNKLYTNLTFAGIEFTSNTIDATGMGYFHMDLWTPDDVTAPAELRIKLVDFGADGVWSGGDDVEHELTFGEETLATEAWVSLDIPLSDFVNLTTVGHLAQLIISGDPNTLYVDNIYFRAEGAEPNTPDVAAPTPGYAQEDVISLYSDAYNNVTVDTWSADWDQADVSDIVIEGDNTKLYTSFVFAGIEFTSQTIDASGMMYFHMDIWTPDTIVDTTEFRIKLVDFGADGVWSGGDDVEHELTFGSDVLVSQSWVSFDIPLADFVNLTTVEHMAQLIIGGDISTVYVDNVFFHADAEDADGETVPGGAAMFRLHENYPNPFNPQTAIGFFISQQADVTLRVYDIRGRLVDTLVNEKRSAGSHEVVWEADGIASGVYFYTLSVDQQPVETRRMTLLK